VAHRVQVKRFSAAATSVLTVSFDAPVAVGNVVLVYAFSSVGASMTAEFGITAMRSELETDFSGGGFWFYRADAAGVTDIALSWAGAGNIVGVAIEVAGLALSSELDVSLDFDPTGETLATSHSCEYTNAGDKRFAFGIARQGDAVTYTGTNGASVAGFPTDSAAECYFTQDGLATGAGAITFDTSGAKTFQYAMLTYREALGPYPVANQTITWASGSTPAAQDVTVAVGSNCAVMFWTYYMNAAGNGLASVTLGGVAPDFVVEIPTLTPDYIATGMAVWFDPPTNTPLSCVVAWDGTPTEGPTTIFQFLADVDTALVPEAGVNQINGGTQVGVTLDTEVDDLMLAYDQKYLSPVPALESGYTNLGTVINGVEYARLRYLYADGATESANTQDTNYSSIAAIAFRAAIGGGPAPDVVIDGSRLSSFARQPMLRGPC
jgi:hypothetical protein